MTILGRSEELVSRCFECDLAEPESLASLGGSAPGVVDGILSLDYTHPSQRAIQTLRILDDSSSTLTPCPTLMANQHVFRTDQHDVSHEAPDYEKFRPYFGWVNVDTVQKTMEQSTQ